MKEREDQGLVKVGRKDISDYISAAFYSLDHFDQAILRGLGGRQSKVISIKKEILDIDSVDEAYSKKKKIDGADALEVKLVKEEGHDE